MVVSQAVIVSTVVLWPRLNVERGKKELGEIQRLLCVTGVMKTMTTDSIEVLECAASDISSSD